MTITSSRQKARGVRQRLADMWASVERAHRATAGRLPARTRHVAGHHIDWWDEAGLGLYLRRYSCAACPGAGRRDSKKRSRSGLSCSV